MFEGGRKSICFCAKENIKDRATSEDIVLVTQSFKRPPKKRLNTFKQLVGNNLRIVLSVFDHFLGGF